MNLLPIIPPAPTHEERYAAFVESMVPLCHCHCYRDRPCDGVLAGGLCDDVRESVEETFEEDDE